MFWTITSYYIMSNVSVAPLSDPTRLEDPNWIRDACLILFVYFSFFLFFCKSVATQIPGQTRRANPNQSPVYSDRFHLSYQNILFMSFRFRVFNYAEAFLNGRLINIYSYTIRLQKGVSCLYKMIYKTIVHNLTLLFAKCHMFKRNDMHMMGYILIPATFSMTQSFLILSYFLFTRNLRIDKNYTLSIFMLSGSIQFYSNFQFNMTYIYHKIMPFISNYTHAYLFSHAFTLQIIDHIKICIFTCFQFT